MMRIIAMTLNGLYLVVVFIFVVIYWNEALWAEGLVMFLIILALTFNLIVLIIEGRGGKSFIGLWFARKALEEKKKIEKLQDNTK